MSQKKSRRWFIGGSVIAATVIGLSFLNLGENLVYFYTPAEAQAKAAELAGQKIKVGAMVKPGSVLWEPETLTLEFVATDLAGHEINVSYKGVKPDLFKEGQGVVVEGRLNGGPEQMVAVNLMVKHSEEYRKPDSSGHFDKALLEKSIFKNE